MSMFIPTENKLVTCPYDEAHKVKSSRLQLHIAKCKLNHLDLTKKVCPFNATHLLPVGEFDHHLTICPERGSLDRQLAKNVDKNNPFKGRTDVPQYSDPIQHDENWEVGTAIVRLAPPPPGVVVEPREFAKPAERRQMYQDLFQAPAATAAAVTTEICDKISSVPVKTSHAPPRQPKHPSAAENVKPNPQVIENLGLGRGRPVSRIAANFPKVESPESAAVNNVAEDMGNLVLGRGKSWKPNKAPVPIFDDDDDFPALGCGRGVVHSQRARHPGAKPKN